MRCGAPVFPRQSSDLESVVQCHEIKSTACCQSNRVRVIGVVQTSGDKKKEHKTQNSLQWRGGRCLFGVCVNCVFSLFSLQSAPHMCFEMKQEDRLWSWIGVCVPANGKLCIHDGRG